ncbi:hypothetical protein A2U01_0064328, partial [Trifolium medium]|nr:hypothetical protein [Trifolium medium]
MLVRARRGVLGQEAQRGKESSWERRARGSLRNHRKL